MTKKTDSLIYRYGIQTLWTNTNFLLKTSVSNSFFSKFLSFELKKHGFELLFIEQKKFNIISIFTFCFFWKSTTDAPKNKTTKLFFKVLLFYKFWFLSQLLYSAVCFIHIAKLTFICTTALLYLSRSIIFFVYKRDYCYPTNITNLGLLSLKVAQLRLESTLSKFFNRPFYLKLHNVFNLPIYFDFIELSNRINEVTAVHLGTIEFMFYLSCKLRRASVFTKFLANDLSLENKHRKVLWSVVNAVNTLSIKLFAFKSIRIYITGKLNGKMRRKTYGFRLGSLTIQQIASDLDYFKATSFTKFGTISVKTWIFF
jgi:hypothetical protein